jgi:hypothetical protein
VAATVVVGVLAGCGVAVRVLGNTRVAAAVTVAVNLSLLAGASAVVDGETSTCVGVGSGVWPMVIVPVMLGVAPGSVGSGVGGVNWVGVGSSVSSGITMGGISVAVAMSVGLGMTVATGAVGAARVPVALTRWRVGVGVI